MLACVALTALGLLSACWTDVSRAFLRPTPTPSATARAVPTETPNFRATRIVEDVLTQEAYGTQVALLFPEGEGPELNGESAVDSTPQPTVTEAILLPDLTATAMSVLLPVIERPEEATATAVAVAQDGGAAPTPGQGVPLETPTPLTQTTNLPVVGQDVTPSATPTASPEPTLAPTPTFTPLPLPPTPTPTAPPTPPTYVVGTLSGSIERQNQTTSAPVSVRLGPSSVYTASATIALGTSVTLQARDPSGEWIYFCCVPGSSTPGWVRAANVRPINNPTPPAPFTGLNPNDTRWLQVRQGEPGLVPYPTNTPAPPNDFPMVRVDRGNSGRVAQLPQLPLQVGWPQGGSAGLAGGE